MPNEIEYGSYLSVRNAYLRVAPPYESDGAGPIGGDDVNQLTVSTV